MYKINIPLNIGPASYNAGDVADLSAASVLDIARMEQEWRSDLRQFVIERIADDPVAELVVADEPAADAPADAPADDTAAPSKKKAK